jgi:hypothetical protein
MKSLLRALGVTLAILIPVAAFAENTTSVGCCMSGCCPDCPFCPSHLHG